MGNFGGSASPGARRRNAGPESARTLGAFGRSSNAFRRDPPGGAAGWNVYRVASWEIWGVRARISRLRYGVGHGKPAAEKVLDLTAWSSLADHRTRTSLQMWPIRSRSDYPRREARRQMSRLERCVGILANPPERILVSWLGGEPLLWTPLTELTVTFQRRFGLDLSTTTNGTTLASPSVREHLLHYYRELTVSVDASGLAHDKLRGSPGLFSRLRRSVMAFAEERAAQRADLRATCADARTLRHSGACLDSRRGHREITFINWAAPSSVILRAKRFSRSRSPG